MRGLCRRSAKKAAGLEPGPGDAPLAGHMDISSWGPEHSWTDDGHGIAHAVEAADAQAQEVAHIPAYMGSCICAHAFRRANLLVLGKLALLPHLHVDLAGTNEDALAINPSPSGPALCAESPQGLERRYDWLRGCPREVKAAV